MKTSKKQTSKKQTPKKQTPKKQTPKKQTPKKQTPKNNKEKTSEIEYEAKFLDINHSELVKKIKKLGATLIQPQTIYKRSMFGLCDVKRGYVRVRDEGIKTTLTSKIYKNPDYPEEFELEIKDGFEKGRAFLASLNLNEKAYHETMREKWFLKLDNKNNEKNVNNENNGCEIAFDCIPGIPMYVEIECKTEQNLNKVIKLLDLDTYTKLYGAYGKCYVDYYGMAETEINNDISRLTFQNIKKEITPYIHKNKELLNKIAKEHLDTYTKLLKTKKTSMR
jgi:adenylate cyclase class IV